MKIDTYCDPKPIPLRDFDWVATFDGYDVGDPVGYGRTEQEAIDALLDMVDLVVWGDRNCQKHETLITL